ncbi:YfbM family protein [Luedemannella helvata]|uniref:DUF1877 family protein n=1 Tax=Luedemannella helvata TaxID=349315 RepID=A0ABP4WYP1_9ACTN
MSMIMQYVRLRSDELTRLRELLRSDPNGAFDFVDELADLSLGDEVDDRTFDTDKAWAGLDHLLEKAGGAPVNVIYGEETLTADDWGYAPPRLLDPDQVRAGAGFLAALPFDTLAAHYDARALTRAGVYPEIWHADERARDYLRTWYDGLVAFFTRAAAAGDSLVIYLT